jgi:Restriction endonuclease
MIPRVSQAEVRQAQVERDRLDRARNSERVRLEKARIHYLKASGLITLFIYIIAVRRFCDRTITRPGGLVNALILGGSLFLIVSSLMGFTEYHRLLAAVAGSLSGAGLGALLLTPSDGATGVRITRWKQKCVELTSLMADAQGKAAEQQKSFEEADALYRCLLSVYLSRRNQLLHSRWPEMTGVDFEVFLASVFQELGYEVRTTPITGDQGVDLIVSKNSRKVAIRAKGRPRSTVENRAVQEAHAGRYFHSCDAAAVITNSEFTPAAKELGATVGCLLIAGHQMRDLIEGRITV